MPQLTNGRAIENKQHSNANQRQAKRSLLEGKAKQGAKNTKTNRVQDDGRLLTT